MHKKTLCSLVKTKRNSAQKTGEHAIIMTTENELFISQILLGRSICYILVHLTSFLTTFVQFVGEFLILGLGSLSARLSHHYSHNAAKCLRSFALKVTFLCDHWTVSCTGSDMTYTDEGVFRVV